MMSRQKMRYEPWTLDRERIYFAVPLPPMKKYLMRSLVFLPDCDHKLLGLDTPEKLLSFELATIFLSCHQQ